MFFDVIPRRSALIGPHVLFAFAVLVHVRIAVRYEDFCTGRDGWMPMTCTHFCWCRLHHGKCTGTTGKEVTEKRPLWNRRLRAFLQERHQLGFALQDDADKI